MKPLALLASLLLAPALPAQAELLPPPDDQPPPDDVMAPPPYSGCVVWLGDAVTINGLHYVPVMVTNEYVRNIRNIWGWGSTPDLELTGTLHPADQNPSLQGHLNGNYWPYSFPQVWSVIGVGWKLQIFGAWDLPLDGPADCTSLPYPNQTGGVAAYLHFVGEGTVRLSRLGYYSGNVCNPPGISYIGYRVLDRTVQFPPPPPPPGGGSGSCGGDPLCIEGLVTGEPAPKPAAPKTTWGRIKGMYR